MDYKTFIDGITLIEHGAIYVATVTSTVFFCYRLVRSEVFKTKTEGIQLRAASQTLIDSVPKKDQEKIV